MIQVIVVDDHPIIRLGLSLLLENTADIQFIGEAESGITALKCIADLKPDIVLLDYSHPDISGPHVSAEIQKMNLITRVLVFSAYSDEDYIIKMLNAGAQGYVLKTESPLMLLDAIRAVARGETWLSPTIAKRLLIKTRRNILNNHNLSHRELEVLHLLAKGYSNFQIAKVLVISRATVKNHLTNIYKNLGVSSRAEAITWVWSNELTAEQHS